MCPSLFDEVAEIYDRARSRYPSALFDDLISLARLPGSARILEKGCGTGQATLGLAGRGYRIVCLEPGGAPCGNRPFEACDRSETLRSLSSASRNGTVNRARSTWSLQPALFTG